MQLIYVFFSVFEQINNQLLFLTNTDLIETDLFKKPSINVKHNYKTHKDHVKIVLQVPLLLSTSKTKEFIFAVAFQQVTKL